MLEGREEMLRIRGPHAIYLHRADNPVAGLDEEGHEPALVGQRRRQSAVLSTFRRVRLQHCLLILALKGTLFFLALLVHSHALSLFGITIPLPRLLPFLPVVFLMGALPVTVAHLGTSQAAWIFFFSDYAPAADLLAYSLVSHLTFMLANGTFGGFFLPTAYTDLLLRERHA